MEDIVEHFGSGLLQGAAWALLLPLFTVFLEKSGMVSMFVQQFLQSVCG